MEKTINIILLLLIFAVIGSIYGIIASLVHYNPTNIENLNIYIMIIFWAMTGILFGMLENLLKRNK